MAADDAAAAAGRALDREVDASERATVGERLDDRDAGDPLRNPLVGVPGDDRVDGSGGESAREPEDLAVVLARAEVVGRVELLADPTRVRGDDHHRRAPTAQLGGGRRDGGAERSHREPHQIRGQRRVRRGDGRHPDDSDLEPGDVDERRGVDVAPVRGRARRGVDQVRVEKRKPRLGRARSQRAARIVPRRARGAGGPDGPEVEFVVSDRDRVVSERGVGAHDGRPLAQVRVERPLKHVPRVDQHHRAPVAGASPAQVGEGAAELGQRLEVTVQIVGPDQRQRDRGVALAPPSAALARMQPAASSSPNPRSRGGWIFRRPPRDDEGDIPSESSARGVAGTLPGSLF